jgi:hypothetical protein
MPAIDIQHVATGAAGGSLVGSRLGTVLLGLLLHLAGDRMPDEDIADRRFEIGSGIGCVLLLAAVRDLACRGLVMSGLPGLPMEATVCPEGGPGPRWTAATGEPDCLPKCRRRIFVDPLAVTNEHVIRLNGQEPLRGRQP